MKNGSSRKASMDYKAAINYLEDALPIYQRIGSLAYKADLNNAFRLDEYFGHAHRSFQTIHIAGTNGKGSVSHMLASVLQHTGYKTGLFTSPHMLDFRERIRVNGKMISKGYITDFVVQHKAIFEEIQPSFFEMSVFLAFSYFLQEKVDIAVIEVGLGGRLDTTNIITPAVSVITNIGLDHTQILGNTIQAIALEKAGIIKLNVPVVVGETQSETHPIFEDVAGKYNSQIWFADDHYSIDYQLENPDGTLSSHFEKCYYWDFNNLDHDLKGLYQRKNIPAVLMTLAILVEKKIIHLNSEKIPAGLKNVVTTTGLMGRWQEIGKSPLIVCDTAHNADGFAEIIKQIGITPYRKLFMILGFVQDKNIKPIAGLLPKDAVYYLCEANIPRAMKVEVLAGFFRSEGLNINVYRKVNDAFQTVFREALPSDMIYVGGSTFVVADFMVWKKQLNSF